MIKVTKGHQVHIFKGEILSSHSQKKTFQVIIMWKSKPSQFHNLKRSSSANIQNVYFSAPMHRKAFLKSWEVKIRLGSLLVTKCKFSMNV